MFNHLNHLLGLTLISLLLSACAGKLAEQRQQDIPLHQLVSQFKNGDSSVTYAKLWNAYLESSQTENSNLQNDLFLEKKRQLDAGKVSCQQVDWEGLIKQNYWNIPPHLAATECYTKMGNAQAAEFHEKFVALILQGIFNSGTGKHYYDAYEVASWGDASDILELAGYKTIDQYLLLKAATQGVYYVVVAEDLQSGIQQEIYFDNIRFINSALGYVGRLGDRKEPLGLTIVKELANSTNHAAIALGDMLTSDKDYELAAEWYIKATLFDSPVAYTKVASLCLYKHITTYSDGACLEFVTKAAELEYANAYVLLSALYQEGIWVDKNDELADTFFQAAIQKKGKGKAYAAMATYYKAGLFGEKNKQKSQGYYLKAKQNGAVESEYVVRLREKAFAKDDKNIAVQKALKELTELAASDNELAQTFLGAKYLFEGSEAKDTEKEKLGLGYVRKAASQKMPYAQYLLGLAYKFGLGVERDYEQAVVWFYKAANSWDSDSQYEVANYLRRKAEKSIEQGGSDGYYQAERDNHYAFDWMNSASRQGNIDAINSLGYYYQNGIGVGKNAQTALSLYKLGFEHKHKYGSYNYANMLRYGKGVKADYQQALIAYKQAAELGDIDSANELGVMYENGFGTEKNMQEAINWYSKAAEQNDKWAQYNLGRCYEYGFGVQRNIKIAKEWYNKSAVQGHQEAKEKLTLL